MRERGLAIFALAALAAGAILAMVTAWTAVRRFGVRQGVALPVVGVFACTAPLATYATQIYPEIPAALAVMVAVAALSGPLLPSVVEANTMITMTTSTRATTTTAPGEERRLPAAATTLSVIASSIARS